MSEVNGPKINLNHINYKGVQKQTSAVPSEVNEENASQQIADFSNNSAEALGRSMLFKGTDSINNDLKALVENPKIAENSDKMFEVAYKAAQDAGLKNPYEEAANVSTASM